MLRAAAGPWFRALAQCSIRIRWLYRAFHVAATSPAAKTSGALVCRNWSTTMPFSTLSPASRASSSRGDTPAVLKALADQCTKALFFPIGKHAMWHPEILKQVAAAGHTIGLHTWSHSDLSKLTIDQAKEEFEKGASAVRAALGEPGASFFRFPALRHPPEMVTYLGTRNIGIFSTDMDSFDFKIRKPEQVVVSVMTELKKRGKGIVLLHDFQHPTSLALPELLARLKTGGYKIVQIRAKDPVKTLPEYDEAIMKEFGGNTVSARPTSSIVRTISE